MGSSRSWMKRWTDFGIVDSDPGLSQSRFYMYDLFELDVTFQVICLMSELESSDILIQLTSEL